MSRREKLQQLLHDDPDDPFLHYGLANEMLKDGDTREGIQVITDVIERFPDYVAAYFRAGQAMAEEGDNQAARDVVTAGIAVARRVGNEHAAGEMTEFLQMLDG